MLGCDQALDADYAAILLSRAVSSLEQISEWQGSDPAHCRLSVSEVLDKIRVNFEPFQFPRTAALAHDSGLPTNSQLHRLAWDGLFNICATTVETLTEWEQPVEETYLVEPPCLLHDFRRFVSVLGLDGVELLGVVTLPGVQRALESIRSEAERVSEHLGALRTRAPQDHAARSLRHIAADLPYRRDAAGGMESLLILGGEFPDAVAREALFSHFRAVRRILEANGLATPQFPESVTNSGQWNNEWRRLQEVCLSAASELLGGENLERPPGQGKTRDRKALEHAAIAYLWTSGPNVKRIAEKLRIPRTTLLGYPLFKKALDKVKRDAEVNKKARRGGRDSGDDFSGQD